MSFGIDNLLNDIKLDIEAELIDHMSDQPYRVICAECNSHLDVDKNIDKDHDLEIKVYPCNCGLSKEGA